MKYYYIFMILLTLFSALIKSAQSLPWTDYCALRRASFDLTAAYRAYVFLKEETINEILAQPKEPALTAVLCSLADLYYNPFNPLSPEMLQSLECAQHHLRLLAPTKNLRRLKRANNYFDTSKKHMWRLILRTSSLNPIEVFNQINDHLEKMTSRETRNIV